MQVTLPGAYSEIAFFKFNLSLAHPKKERCKGKRQLRSRADSLRYERAAFRIMQF